MKIKQYRADRNGNISYHTSFASALAETKYSATGNGSVTTFSAPAIGELGWSHEYCVVLKDREYVNGKLSR